MIERLHVALLLVGILLGGGCFAFPDLQPGCGNRVVEAHEDCDDPDDRNCNMDCRITCEPLAKQSECPTDKFCGNDKICRAPSGTFAAAIRIERRDVLWIETGDLDGNRRADLVVQFDDPDLEVIHYDMNGVATVHLDDSFGRAAVGGLAGDGRDDVVFAHVAAADMAGGATGLGLLGEVGSDAARTPIAATFATVRTDGDIGRLLAVTPERDRVLEIVSPTVTRRWVDGAPDALLVDTPISIDAIKLGEAVAFADLDGVGTCMGGLDVGDFPRPEVALASNGDTAVRIASTCGGTDPVELDYLPDVALPDGALGKAGSFFVDVNDDSRLDLVAQAATGEILVAFGVGDGTFHSDTDVPAVAGDGTFATLPLWSTGHEDALLAVADFDGDGAVELVTKNNWVATPESCMDGCPYAWPDELKTAVAVDINDDGTLDVVGIHGETAVMHLYELGDEPPFKSHEVELLGIGLHLSIGDFDRDTVDDVAFVEADDAAPPTSAQHVTALYGGPGAPGQMDRFGPFNQVETITVEHGQTIVARTKDVLARPAGAFIRPGTTAQDFGLAIRAPVLVSASASLVAASIVLPPGADTERLAHFGFRAGTLSPHDVVVGAELVGLTAGTGPTALAAAIDLDANRNVEVDPEDVVDLVDEIVVLGTTQQGGSVWVARLDPASGLWSIVDAFPVAQGSFARRPLVTDPDAPAPPDGPGSTIAVGDYDGDGDLDVLATLDRPVPTVVVLRNDGGELSHSARVLFSEQTQFEYAFIEPWHPNAAGQHRFLVGGDEGVGVIEIDLDDHHIVFDEVESTAATALASADVDGDALLDLIVGTSDEILIHLAQGSFGAL